MIKNYLITAWRNLLHNKVYGTLTVFGLAAGITVTMVIGLWVSHEYSYDKFLPNYQQLYQVRRNFNSNGEILNFKTTSLKLADALQRQVPEIDKVVVTDWMGAHGLSVGDKKLYIRGGIVDTNFLNVFQFPLVKGNASVVMRDPYTIVLTTATAKSLFGTDDAINKIVRLDNQHNLTVTGILKDLPGNSSFAFNYLIPFTYLEQTQPQLKASGLESFGNNNLQIFVRLKSGISMEQVAQKIEKITHSETGSNNAMNSFVVLQPMARWHLYTSYVNGKDLGGFIDYVQIFIVIAILVLTIACINFINLTTARSEKRAKEIGVRKAVGSLRRDLIFQFLIESFLLIFLAFLVAFMAVLLVLPYFNQLVQKDVSIPFSKPLFWISILVALLFTTLAAGAKPALFLSGFQTIKVLKGKWYAGKNGGFTRKLLVVIQFSCSIALIIGTIVIYQQIQYAKNRPLGFDTGRLLMTDQNGDLSKNYNAIKNELLQKGIAEYVTISSSPATQIFWHSDIDKWPGKNAGENIEMATVVVGADYFKTMGIDFLQGNDFSGTYDSTKVIFNEAAISQMRLKHPMHQFITWNGHQFDIIGITKNALISSPFTAAEPTMFLVSGESLGSMSYRLAPNISTKDAIQQLTEIFSRYNPAYPFLYEFADANYAQKFNLELLIGKLAGIFATLAILISSLGLFGLAAYVAEQRTKEIGIRKVLGASISQIWLMLSKDFIGLVVISCVIAIPIALYFLQNWLDGYSYRIHINAGVFLLASAAAIITTMITISYQSIKAALANPVNSLKRE
jgi:putative ABC transport system permease protein